MKFQKIIDISETDIIQEINETFSNEKRKNLIMQILPYDDVGDLDLDFLLTIMKSISKKVMIEVNGTGSEVEAKKINKDIQNLHKRLLNDGWI